MYRIWLSVFGAGYSPIVPGTCGSAVVMGLFLLAALLGGTPGVVGAIMVVAAVHGFVVTVLYGDKFIEQYGKDPSQIVSDEQCGQAVTYLGYFWLGAELGGMKGIVGFALLGFVLFRLFDIVKPPPVRQLENIRGAWGVLLDDVMAGIYALVVMQILFSVGWLGFLGQ